MCGTTADGEIEAARHDFPFQGLYPRSPAAGELPRKHIQCARSSGRVRGGAAKLLGATTLAFIAETTFSRAQITGRRLTVGDGRKRDGGMRKK